MNQKSPSGECTVPISCTTMLGTVMYGLPTIQTWGKSEYLVSGTITGSNKFQDEKQTKLSRCTFRLPTAIIELPMLKYKAVQLGNGLKPGGFELDT